MKQSLNGTWHLFGSAENLSYDINADVPGSVYYSLLKENLIPNPYYGENEYITTDISRGSCTYERTFDLEERLLVSEKLLLKFYGIDTWADIVLNGEKVGTVCNMHREYIFDITHQVKEKDNLLSVHIKSPVEYIETKNKETPLWGVSSTMEGFPHMRKAHYMFGWDWGPKLPDMGIWRNVEIIGVNGGRLDGVYVKQDHSRVSEGIVHLDIETTVADFTENKLRLEITLCDPDGNERVLTDDFIASRKSEISADVENAQLWYPRGYGDHPLYRLTVVLYSEKSGEPLDGIVMNIGLRTIELSRDPLDIGGEEFAFVVNGIKIFAMGANYIPENQIISKCSASTTQKLLKQCCLANFNMIRVWGGGYYPEDYFYDACDSMGLLVWQDFMFACAVYKADVDFCENVKRELIDNVKRLRNHPSLALWCGNNEIESAWQYWSLPSDAEFKKDYLRLFEVLMLKVLAFYDPVTPYWPSSPSSGGSFNDSGSLEKGDQHYWEVWHSLKPFTEYYKYKFRFCSEYGFESLPSYKTIRTFAEEKDLNLCSPVMEAHQKCEQGTEKIMYYLAQMSHYPYDFKGLIYATQMVQADAIRLNVENMRRNRGVCSGSLYWQVNDSNPVISWSSIDYYHRWKALHYAAKDFYAPVLLSADSLDPDEIKLNVSSERQSEFTAAVRWRSHTADGNILAQGSAEIVVKPLSAEYVLTLTPEMTGITKSMRDKAYIEYSLIEKGIKLSGGTCMLVRPKSFRFVDPGLSYMVTDMGSKFKIEVSAKAFAKSVFLDLKEGDCLFSDNWFDLHGNSTNVYVSKSNLPEGITPMQFAENLSVISYYEALKLS